MREKLCVFDHDRMYYMCKGLEQTGSKLLLMFWAMLVSKDRRMEHGERIVTKPSNKCLDEEGKDVNG